MIITCVSQPQERTTLKYLRAEFSEYCGESNDKGKYGHKVYGFILPLYTGKPIVFPCMKFLHIVSPFSVDIRL